MGKYHHKRTKIKPSPSWDDFQTPKVCRLVHSYHCLCLLLPLRYQISPLVRFCPTFPLSLYPGENATCNNTSCASHWLKKVENQGLASKSPSQHPWTPNTPNAPAKSPNTSFGNIIPAMYKSCAELCTDCWILFVQSCYLAVFGTIPSPIIWNMTGTEQYENHFSWLSLVNSWSVQMNI